MHVPSSMSLDCRQIRESLLVFACSLLALFCQTPLVSWHLQVMPGADLLEDESPSMQPQNKRKLSQVQVQRQSQNCRHKAWLNRSSRWQTKISSLSMLKFGRALPPRKKLAASRPKACLLFCRLVRRTSHLQVQKFGGQISEMSCADTNRYTKGFKHPSYHVEAKKQLVVMCSDAFGSCGVTQRVKMNLQPPMFLRAPASCLILRLRRDSLHSLQRSELTSRALVGCHVQVSVHHKKFSAKGLNDLGQKIGHQKCI